MIWLFIILSFLGLIGFIIFTYEKKIFLLKKDIMITNSHLTNLKSKFSKRQKNSNLEKVFITFIGTDYKTGIINENSSIFISPFNNSYLIQKTSIKMEVAIIDKARTKGLIWYYVFLPIDTNINCKGWVLESDFNFFYSNESILNK